MTKHWQDPRRLALLGAGLTLALGVAGCDEAPVADAPVAVEVTALAGTSCGDPNAPNVGVDPFADIGSLTIAVRGLDPDKGIVETLVRESASLRGATSLRVRNVPEGPDREVILFADGASQDWYANHPSVDIQRNTDNVVSLLLTRYGGLSCVPAPATIPNVVFPAAVDIGHGRVMVSGGFTEVVAAGGATKLASPSSAAFIFDSQTGALTPLGSMGDGQGRAAHAMVYLPSAQQVLIVGGLMEMRLDEARAFPYVFDPEDKGHARTDYVIYDIAANTFRAGLDEMKLGRAFPRAHALSDGTAVITGGGPWPFDPDETDYVEVDIYDPEDNDLQGGLLDVKHLESFYSRAGHSLTYLRSTEEGLSQLLVWGGTTPARSVGHPAEVFRQSGRQRDLVNGTFAEVVIVGEPPAYTYFHETTRLTGERFLVTGGAAFDDGINAPRPDEAWLLTYVEEPVPTIQVQKVPGLGVGRVFHSALSHDLVNVSVIGGLMGLDAITSDKVMRFDLSEQLNPWQVESANEAFAPRGGQAGVMQLGGTILLVGGEGSMRPQETIQRASVEVFTPTSVTLP
ncbi:MAG: hypothetical protein CSA66_02335 [Proteobacteria bacterium]|nr:MAG: hypothetical protein CSA66_02335 [Pseudomonadota bacterium]